MTQQRGLINSRWDTRSIPENVFEDYAGEEPPKHATWCPEHEIFYRGFVCPWHQGGNPTNVNVRAMMKTPKRKQHPQKTIDRAMRLQAEGKTPYQISKLLGVAIATVWEWMNS